MWVKVLGLICAGVFVGAALVEAKQLRKRHREGKQAAEQEQDRDSGADAGAVESELDGETPQNA
jgi:hypothetical protein